MKTLRKIIIIHLAIVTVMSVAGCKKLVEVSAPSTSLTSGNVFATDPTAIAAVNNIYIAMYNQFFNDSGYPAFYSVYGALSSDELTLDDSNNDFLLTYCYKNAQNATSGGIIDVWSNTYPLIYQANAVIDGLNTSSSLTPSVKTQLLGEAKFLRAYFYFYLVNFYGDVPIATSSDYTQNNLATRSSVDLVYRQMIIDLTAAENSLSAGYLDGTLLKSSNERTRPTKWAAAALLSRVYLYYADLKQSANFYTHSEKQADSVINNSSLYSLVGLDGVFLKNSQEAIWQIQSTANNYNTFEGYLYLIPSTGVNPSNDIYLSKSLLNAFEPNDQRYKHWVTSTTIAGTTYYMPYKFKKGFDATVTSFGTLTEYEMILRLGEQYLIRAEAKADLNDASAVSDLNAIRTRANLPGYSGSNDIKSLKAAILRERRIELFTEGAHRWFDRKRTGNIGNVMGSGGACAAKGGTWTSNAQLYPISVGTILKDKNLVQNPGY